MEDPSMSRLDDLKTRYMTQMQTAEGTMAQYYSGVMLGIELAAGAIAQDRQEELLKQVETLQATLDSVTTVAVPQRSWQRPGTPGNGRKDMDQLVEVYQLRDPRDDSVFYVGSASVATDQVRDYMRTPGAKVSCKAILNELQDNGLEPVIEVVETGVRLADANASKSRLMEALRKTGATLTNQR